MATIAAPACVCSRDWLTCYRAPAGARIQRHVFLDAQLFEIRAIFFRWTKLNSFFICDGHSMAHCLLCLARRFGLDTRVGANASKKASIVSDRIPAGVFLFGTGEKTRLASAASVECRCALPCEPVAGRTAGSAARRRIGVRRGGHIGELVMRECGQRAKAARRRTVAVLWSLSAGKPRSQVRQSRATSWPMSRVRVPTTS